MSTANDLTQAAKQDFMDRNKNLLALTKEGPNGVFRRVAASLALDQKLQDDVLIYADHLDQQNEYARSVSRADFQREMYTAICKAFLKCQNNFVIEFVAKLTGEALVELEDIEIEAGQRAPRAVEPPPPPPRSAQEVLEDQVREDWHRLETSKMRKKMNEPAYKAVVDKLMADGSLESQITTLTDGAQEFRS